MTETPTGQAQFATCDPEQATEFIRRAYADHTVRIGGDSAGFVFRHDYQPGDGFVLARMRHSMSVGMDAEPLHDRMIAVDRVDRGRLSFETERDTVFSAPDRPVLLPPSAPWRCRWEDPDVEVVTLDWHAVAGYAAEATAISAEELEFVALEPISPKLARYWIDTVEHVRSDVLGDPVVAASAIIRAQAFRSLVTALLSCFPNTALAAVTDPERSEVTGDMPIGRLRHVLDYLDEHADDPVGRADLAGVADAPYGEVVQSVRRRYGVHPAQLLWKARLGGAFRELLDADPDTGTTVATTAARWGFANLSTFTVAYRAATGEKPEETLRR
jgi:AraC-like DNA-binding protein